ncbi:MAG: VWA domain-containing protein, partial [Ruthenibacterium sp.]
GMTLTKTAVPTGAGMWDVTLSVADTGAQTLSGPMDIVLLLDCSVSMASPVESKVKAAHAPPPTPHAAQSTNIAQGISAAQRTSAKMLPMLSFAALRPDESKGTGPASTGVPRRAAVPAQAGATPTADVKQSTTRIAAAKDAAAEFLAALKSMGVPARVGVVAYAGTAQILLAPTSLINAQDAAAVQNAVGNLWQVAYGAKDLCYGGGGTNLEQAFSAA